MSLYRKLALATVIVTAVELLFWGISDSGTISVPQGIAVGTAAYLGVGAAVVATHWGLIK